MPPNSLVNKFLSKSFILTTIIIVQFLKENDNFVQKLVEFKNKNDLY